MATATKPKRKRKSNSYGLYLHPTGQWCIKIKGESKYFGTNEQNAIVEYCQYLDQQRNGVQPTVETVKDLCNKWIDSKIVGPELTQRSYDRYFKIGYTIVKTLGDRYCSSLGPNDMTTLRNALHQTPTSLAVEVAVCRMVFKYGNEYHNLAIKYSTLKMPSRGTIRRHKAQGSKRMYEPTELRKILRKSPPAMKPMILLGLNAGLGNQDVAELRWEHLSGNWCDYPRRKTGINRRFMLWPETIKALGKRGTGRICTMPYSSIGKFFTETLKATGLYRPRVGFYVLRHVFQTIGNRAKDAVAVHAVMGHVDDSMSANYTEEPVQDDRLVAVTDCVRKWLFAKP
jgi:integrase